MKTPSFFRSNPARQYRLMVVALLVGALFQACGSSSDGHSEASDAEVLRQIEIQRFRRADHFASRYAAMLMHETYPNSGHQPTYTLDAWSYDEASRRYQLDLTAGWQGKTCLLCDDECAVEVRGTLQVYDDGTYPRFHPQTYNACARRHGLNALVAGLTFEVLKELADE